MAGAGLLNALPCPAQTAARPFPRLLVVLIGGQLRTDYLDRVNHLLTPGGFRRLMEQGAWYPDCRHRASTFT